MAGIPAGRGWSSRDRRTLQARGRGGESLTLAVSTLNNPLFISVRAGAQAAADEAGVELEVAGQNADQAVPGMRAHLVGCPACHEDHESLKAFVQASG